MDRSVLHVPRNNCEYREVWVYTESQNKLKWKGSTRVIKSICWLLHITDQESHMILEESHVPKNIIQTLLEFWQHSLLEFTAWHCDYLSEESLPMTSHPLYVKNLYLISKLSLPWHPSRPVTWVLPLGTAEISDCPSSCPHEEVVDCSVVSP